jgi:N-acyl homoserine lactone hydrolase
MTNSSATRLYLMQVGYFAERNLPFVCYLIQTSDGKNILVDTGLPDGATIAPGMPTPTFYKNVVEQLAEIDLKPEDINYLVSTHYDGDHSGHHGDFPHAEHIVQRSHFDDAQQNPRYAQTRAQWDQPTYNYRFVEGDTTLLLGVELLDTTGHAMGHQSVLVRLPETGAVILAIDAVPNQASFVPNREATPRDTSAEDINNSTQKLMNLAESEHAGLVIFGHDGVQWDTLKKLPEYYD